MKIICAAFMLFLQTLKCLALDDSEFQLTNTASGFCLVVLYSHCAPIRWTTSNRLLVPWRGKCLGVEGKSVGSAISLYDCDESSELQKWECRNETLLALKGQELYMNLTAAGTAVLSKAIGPTNHLTISGTPSGACTRTYRELYTIAGNANGRVCMFPFMYKDNWYSGCTTADSPNKRWCAIETKFEHELWGYCPTNSKEQWTKHPVTGAYYQVNAQSALTWAQAETSCKQQGASLLSITDPHEQAYITALQTGGRGQGDKLWIGLIQNPEHGWRWSDGKPYRYMSWNSGHPLSDPGHNCAVTDGALNSWQSMTCKKKLGYICYTNGLVVPPTEAAEAGFCSAPWIPYNGHCFLLNRTLKTWPDAQRDCRSKGGDLVSIRNLEDQSFVISQLGYEATDELWIGLNDRKTEKLFDWSDHSTVSFTSWESGKPAIFTDQEDCVLIRGENGNWADLVCTEKHGFICMMQSASEPTGDEVEQQGCKTGWKRHGSYCYLVGTQTKTFDEAKEDCKSSDSYLADVSNGVDNAFLVSLVGLRPEKYFWLGLSNQRDIYEFEWTNKPSVQFTHWNAEMPGHLQGCVAMTTGVFAGLWDVLPCTNKQKYICKHLAEGAVPTPVPPTVSPPKCADGWSPVTRRSFCYKFYQEHTEKRTWYEARAYCRAIGGDLLSIHSPADIQMPHSFTTVWIGLSSPDPDSGFVWSDGSPMNYQHWEDGQPDNQNDGESCGELVPYKLLWGKSWNDAPCESYNGWVCQIRAGVTPNPPPAPVTPDYNTTSDGWIEWRGNQYYINQQPSSMGEARQFCKQRHGDLVSISSKAENTFLWKRISRGYGFFWIGLTVDLDETSEWMDGSQMVFKRWGENQPLFSNYEETCGYMSTHHGFWYTSNCGAESQSICKRSVSSPVNTTLAPTEAPKGGCPSGWKKFNSKCYNIFNDQKVTWENGRKQCKSMKGNLASISSRHVQVFLMTQMAGTPTSTSDLWIGFQNLNGNDFYWSDGQSRRYLNFGRKPFDYVFWHWLHQDDYDIDNALESNCAVINTSPSSGIGKWIPKSCNDINGFICLKDVEPSWPDAPEPTPGSYFKIMNDSMKVVSQQMTWDAAMRHCEADGAKLTNLRNEWSQAYVELEALNLNAPLWIGMNKMQTNGYFRFIDGWPISATHWGENEPSSDRPCVYVDVDGKWKTAACNQTMGSVCIKSSDVPPTESGVFPGVCPEDPDPSLTEGGYTWLPFRAFCYIFFTELKSWADASTSCVRHGGSLVSIEDPSEQEFILRNIRIFADSHPSFWLGLFKTHKEEWLWLDKTVMDYSNWAQDEPSYESNAKIMTSDGTWKTDDHWGRPYICKIHKVIPSTPSSAPSRGLDLRQPGHVALTVVLVILGIAVAGVIAVLIYKKSGRSLPIPARITAFDNPLFFNKEQGQSGFSDTDKLVVNAPEENPEPITTLIDTV